MGRKRQSKRNVLQNVQRVKQDRAKALKQFEDGLPKRSEVEEMFRLYHARHVAELAQTINRTLIGLLFELTVPATDEEAIPCPECEQLTDRLPKVGYRICKSCLWHGYEDEAHREVEPTLVEGTPAHEPVEEAAEWSEAQDSTDFSSHGSVVDVSGLADL